MRGIERRCTVGVSFTKGNTALPNHAVDMIDRARNELLKQVERLLIAELVEPWPELFLRMNLFHADAGGLRAGLKQPGTGNPGHEFAKMIVVEQVDEFGDEDAFFPGPLAHRQLVAKIANGSEAHAGDTEMLAKGGNILHVEFIESRDSIDGLRPCSIAHGVNQILQRKLFRHGEYFVDTFEWPRCVAKFFGGQQKNAAADGFAGADEFLALFVGTDTENGERPALQHSTPPGDQVTSARIIQRPRARGIEIAETVRPVAPMPFRCAPRLRRARSASLSRASSLFREARHGTSQLPAPCAGLRVCRYPPRCADGARRLLSGQNGGWPAGSTRPTARARRFFQKSANAGVLDRGRPGRPAMNPRCRCVAGRRACGICDRRTASLLRSKILHSGRRGRRRAWELRWESIHEFALLCCTSRR